MNKTKIDYCDFTWNSTHGCSHAGSPGCDNCWAHAMSKRLAAMDAPGYSKDDPFRVVCMPNKLKEPLKHKKPTVIAVSFMGDLFHKNVPDEFIDRVFNIMSLTPRHRYIILTKRAERMYNYFQENRWGLFSMHATPLPNVIGMVTVEDQKTADERVPWLLKTPFAMHGVSVEPMIAPVQLTDLPANAAYIGKGPNYNDYFCALTGRGFDPITREYTKNQQFWKLNLVIVGGESGRRPRPMHINWVRNLRDKCVEADTPYFFKQWGEWAPIQCPEQASTITARIYTFNDGTAMERVGKKAAGHLLDRVEWHQMPAGMKI